MNLYRKVDYNGYFIEDVLLDETPYLTELYCETITNPEGMIEEVYYEYVVMKDIVDENGAVIDKEPVLSPYYIENPCPQGYYKPKWDFELLKWVEGLTQEEIDAIKNIMPELTTEEKLVQLVNQVAEAQLAIMYLSLE